MFVRSGSMVRLLVVCLAASVLTFAVENSTPGPNSDPSYQQLRALGLSGEAVSVNNLALTRDAATFHLRSGTVCFVPPVNGKVTGAVFVGEGTVSLDPPVPMERATLKLLTKEDEFSEKFNHLVLRFTDATYDEIKRSGTAASAGCDAGLLKDSQNAMRHNLELKYNVEARLLQDVLSPEPGKFFLAFIHGKRYNDKELFAIDPHGAPPLILPLAPEEVELATYDDNKLGAWASFHLTPEYKNGEATGSQKNALIHIEHQELDATMERNAELEGKAVTTFVSQVNGLRVVPFNLFRTLRVHNVTGDGGQQLSFIQEGKNDDADFAVILPKPVARGEKVTITTTYGGKDAVRNEGNGNYYPVARENWYPSNYQALFGEYSTYDLTFRIPKGMKVAGTGSLVKESNEGGQNVSVWKSDAAQTVAGFNFGNFKAEEAKLTKPEYLVESYANENPPDWVKNLQNYADNSLPSLYDHAPRAALGTMNTTGLNKKALAESQMALQLYSDYFGPSSFKRLSVSQQTACNYGQAWPGLVWIPLCYYFDTTIRHQLGMDWGDRGYWKIVTPHEVAHQWWGHTVGFSSYRDQWMSEGFAELSASLYLQMVEQNPKKFVAFWNDERELLLERNPEGYRAIDAGPLTMGYRMSNSRTGPGITRRLIYPKGGYVLHMLRMMMWDQKTHDQDFKIMMQDFVKTYANTAATTEDFKAMVEKHMTRSMKSVNGLNMDWFFDEYVYGTQLPNYHFDYARFEPGPNGDMVFSFKLTQSGVNEQFRMLVPIYLDMGEGKAIFIGRATIGGNSSLEQKIPLNGLKTAPRRAVVNYFDDVLGVEN